MKKVLLLMSLLVIALGVFAQTPEDADNDIMLINLPQDGDNEEVWDYKEPGYFGFYLEELNAAKAKELGYTKPGGLLITKVVDFSPAEAAGLEQDDIIIRMNRVLMLTMDDFDTQMQEYYAGDEVVLSIWRDQTELKKEVWLGFRSSFESSDAEVDDYEQDSVQEKSSGMTTGQGFTLISSKPTGYGGGGWTWNWFHTDMKDINMLMADLGFSEFRDQGVLTSGIGGKGHIGRGLFLGGQFYGFEDKRSRADGDFKVNMRYELSMGGVTFDKRYALHRNWIASIGLMLGGASHNLTIDRIKNEYDWPVNLNNLANGSFSATFSRDYMILQPRVELLYRVVSWLGVRLEAGYALTYASTKGWRVKDLAGYDSEVLNSPDTKMGGFTIGIGPWFGF